MPEPIVLSWSGGKDSAMALYELRQSDRYEVVALLTTVAEEYGRVSHHGVRVELLERQAAAVGVPLDVVYLSTRSSYPCRTDADSEVMTRYEELMREKMLRYKAAGTPTVAFGDIFLQHLREYRESNLAKIGMAAVFPIWHRSTAELVRSFVRLGFKACLSCVDAEKLGKPFVGCTIDDALIERLPAGTDPCGEYGEYHSFVYDGPIFREPVGIALSEIVLRESRYFIDLLPAATACSVAL